MLDEKTLQEIKNLAIKIDWDQAFGGKSKGNKHLLRVTKIAKFLAARVGADLKIVEAGALLHDTPLPGGDDSNYQSNKEAVMKVLKDLDLTATEKEKIAECVASHEGTADPKTLEAKVVHDADALEKAGMLGIIRHTWKLTNLQKIDPGNINDRTVREILDHLRWRRQRLQTSLAKRISDYLSVDIKGEEAKQIVSTVAKLARQGMITEEIAAAISDRLNKIQREKLKEQLNLRYLQKFKN